MNILVLNVGSSSIKYAVYSCDKDCSDVILSGNHERVTTDALRFTAMESIFSEFESKSIIIEGIGHRIVHGGTISDSQLLNPSLISLLYELAPLAPLHEYPELFVVNCCSQKFKNLAQIAVFDTAFHCTLPKKAYTYALQDELCKRLKIRKYGFHGTSHSFVSKEAIAEIKKKNSRIITCHLGNGCSLAAIRNGQSVDTSMGFTPLAGVVMGTRSGSIDPGIINYLINNEKVNADEVNKLLNEKSGLLGICGYNDMRDIHERYKTDEKAALALDVFCYSVQKYVGQYLAVLGGVDAIVFTGGIGENAWYVRQKILENFGFIGLNLDLNNNKKNSRMISSKKSKVKVFVIKTDEQRLIAEETCKLLKAK